MPERAAEARRPAMLMVTGAVIANLASVGLGSVFDHPDVLQEPAAQVLAQFRDNQVAVSALFLVLTVGAGLLAPIAIGSGRLAGAYPPRLEPGQIRLTLRAFGRPVAALGLASAVLIASGAVTPLGVPGTGTANFVGYVLWSLWLISFAVAIWRGRPRAVGSGPSRPLPADDRP